MLYPYNKCQKLYGQYARPESTYHDEEGPFHDIFMDLCFSAYESKLEEKYGEPMLWIGIYIAVASLLCTLAMGADLLHGFRNRKLWFPCKYFTINATSLMVITVAMKLPVDMSTLLLGTVDRVANRGSMIFMCTMMVNSMPSLANMSDKELLANFRALGIIVLTVAVNVCIEIINGVSLSSQDYVLKVRSDIIETVIAIIYVALLLFLLLILTCSTLVIPTSKWILESKYQARHNKASKEQESWQRTGMSTFERIAQNVSRYWVMAGTGSPQFVMATSPTCSASGIICVSLALFHISNVISIFMGGEFGSYFFSDYKWSTLLIVIIHATGVVLGTVAPSFRCFAALSFKLSIKWSRNHIKVFRVESYWTQKLSDLKQRHLPFPIACRRCKLVVHHVKNQILSCCIGIQKAIVVACKAIGLLPIFFVIIIIYCFYGYRHLKRIFFGEPFAPNSDMVPEYQQNSTTKELSCYVLQLNDKVELAERTLKGISKSLNCLIKKAEEQMPNYLLKFLEKPLGFEGVEQLNSNSVLRLLTEKAVNCWSLTVITLTSIAVSIPKISNDKIESLLRSVDEGLLYASLVEEGLNTTNDSVNYQKAAKKLWLEVEVYHKWLNNNLLGDAFKGKTLEEILKLLMDRANDIKDEVESGEDGPNEISLERSIVASSMYCITRAILLSGLGLPEPISEEQLFTHLSTMIADVLGACFTNLPEVISMKCYASAIEKREESVKAAVQLLGQTKEIMNKLQVASASEMEV